MCFRRRAEGSRREGRDDAGDILQPAETAPPVESLDVVARILRGGLEAVAVSFVITDFTGSSVARLGTEGSFETGELA